MFEVNEILLRRKNKVILAEGNRDYVTTKTEKAMVVSIAKNIEAYGFTFSPEVLNILLTFTRDEIEVFYKELIPKLKKLVGADKEYYPMYPNFPQQVMEASDIELFVNAILHYFTFGQWMPEYEKDERLPLFDSNKMTVLSVGNASDVMDILSNLVSSKTSLSEQDKCDVETIIKTYPEYHKYLPDEIPLKENVALIGKIILEEAPIKKASYIQKYYKTATDVLRLVTCLSDGDISLATRTKYRSLKRAERRMIMDLLAGCGNIIEDLFRYHYQWIRVGEIIHPFEYKAAKYNSINDAFKILREDNKPLMFGGKVQAAILAKDMKTAATLLKERPGEFARQLDKVMRDASDKNYILNCFKAVANDISTPVLLQVRQHFQGRNNQNPIRVFFPKGNLARAIVIPNELVEIEDRYCKSIVQICENALLENYKSKDYMGKVYIDSELKNYIVPFNQRSASSANKIIIRGSQVPIKEDATAVRGFIWWTNMDSHSYGSRVDIDLSAAIYDENWNYVSHVSYTNLRDKNLQAFHSGDITDGGSANGKGVAEFLDVNIDAVAKRGRYIVYQVYSFTGQKFSDMPNCRFGWMEREDVASGEIFEPKTVAMSLDVTSESTVAIPVIFDCKERKFIWCDMNLGINDTSRRCRGNNLESNLSGVTATCYAMTHLNKANIYDLVRLNVEARGLITTNRNEADIIFSNDTTIPVEVVEVEDEITKEKKFVQRERNNVSIITAYDADYYMGQLL